MRQTTLNGFNLWIREGTTDEKVIVEVIKKNAYNRRGFLGFDAGDRWLDLGANIGTFSLMALRAGGSVVALEPEADNFGILGMNIAANGYDAKATLINAAVGVKSGTALLYLSGKQNKYRHTLKPIRGRESVFIDLLAVDTLPGGSNAVKLDIEGAELSLFDSGYTWPGFGKMVFEYHFDFDRLIANFQKRMDFLRSIGFELYHGNLPDRPTYDFYPASKIVYARRTSSTE